MVLGLGCDLIEIARVQTAASAQGFVDKVFTKNEQKWFARHPGAQHVAGLFAAKEAVCKALGTGIAMGIKWTDIEILHTEAGQPVVQLFEGAKKRLESLSARRVMVTISHSRDNAMACAILEG